MWNIGFYVAAVGFLAGVGYVSLYSFSWGIAGLIALLTGFFLLGFALARRPLYLFVVVALLAALVGSVRTVLVPTQLPPEFKPLLERKIALSGVVVAQPDLRESGNRLTVEVEKEGAKTRLVAVAPPYGEYGVGDKVNLSGILKPPQPFETDGGRVFAYDAFLAKDGVFALVSPAYVEVTGRDTRLRLTLLRALQSVRDGFMRSLSRALPEPESALAAGLIAGGKQGLGKELLAVFTVTGLLHIVVLSGYNVMIVAEAVLRALGFLPQRLALTFAGATIALFVLAAGTGAAALRAGLMALLGLLARATGRTYAVMRALFVVLVLLLLWNPLLLVHDPGFQFSFVATAGLILLASRFEKLCAFIPAPAVREVAASTCAAQVAVLPILLFHTGNLSIVSFVVNVLVLPVIPLAMGLSTVAAGFAFVLPAFLGTLVTFVALPAYAALAYVIGAARLAASLPYANLVIPAFPFWLVAASYLGMAAFLWRAARARPAPV